jgi:hypothetical protein
MVNEDGLMRVRAVVAGQLEEATIRVAVREADGGGGGPTDPYMWRTNTPDGGSRTIYGFDIPDAESAGDPEQ